MKFRVDGSKRLYIKYMEKYIEKVMELSMDWESRC